MTTLILTFIIMFKTISFFTSARTAHFHGKGYYQEGNNVYAIGNEDSHSVATQSDDEQLEGDRQVILINFVS